MLSIKKKKYRKCPALFLFIIQNHYTQTKSPIQAKIICNKNKKKRKCPDLFFKVGRNFQHFHSTTNQIYESTNIQIYDLDKPKPYKIYNQIILFCHTNFLPLFYMSYSSTNKNAIIKAFFQIPDQYFTEIDVLNLLHLQHNICQNYFTNHQANHIHIIRRREHWCDITLCCAVALTVRFNCKHYNNQVKA